MTKGRSVPPLSDEQQAQVEALLSLELRAYSRRLMSQAFGVPISMLQARAEVQAHLSDHERARLAKDVTPTAEDDQP